MITYKHIATVQHSQLIKTLYNSNHLQLFDTIHIITNYNSKTLQYFAKVILSSRVSIK